MVVCEKCLNYPCTCDLEDGEVTARKLLTKAAIVIQHHVNVRALGAGSYSAKLCREIYEYLEKGGEQQ